MTEIKDWTGNFYSIYRTIGASNHTVNERQQHDFYATEPKAAQLLLQEETFAPNIWECACGQGHLSKVLEQAGYSVRSTDIVYRGFGEIEPVDFLFFQNAGSFDGDIITNPPYKYALEFVKQALHVVKTGHKIAMFLKLTFLEGKERKQFFMDNPPKTVYVSSSRLLCAKNGEFEKMIKGGGSAVAYAWFVWVKGYQGDTVIKWIN